jgi:CTP:molybdopterin cytidylyltransferase MocA
MGEATVIILHPPPDGDGPLTTLLDDARSRLADHQAALFADAGATRVSVDRRPRSAAFGTRLDELAESIEGGIVLIGAGGVPRLRAADARLLVEAAKGHGRAALTNNRYSSDVLAVADAGLLRGLGEERGDNALPRRLAERGVAMAELPGRDRLAVDLDTPLDLALLALSPDLPDPLRPLAAAPGLSVPRLVELRALAANPRAELLVFGRSSAHSLAWLERRTACRIRFLAEERGLRTAPLEQRPARATLGRLLAVRGPAALASIVAELADGAILDSRVLLADRIGRDEGAWPCPEDRYASDLLRPADISDGWLRSLTASAAGADLPILLGGHTLVGPGLSLLLGGRGAARRVACR